MLSLDWHGLGVRMKAFVRRPPPLVFVFVLLVLFELEESVQPVPTIRLLEDAICNQEYRDRHILGGVEEPMCKTPPIQAKLARIRGLSSFFDSLPGMLPAIFTTFPQCSPKSKQRLYPAHSLVILPTGEGVVWRLRLLSLAHSAQWGGYILSVSAPGS